MAVNISLLALKLSGSLVLITILEKGSIADRFSEKGFVAVFTNLTSGL